MTGFVKSNKMTKAMIVEVQTVKVNQKYQKRFKSRKRYAVACNDSSKFKVGQTVNIVSCPPVSKTIHFKVIEE